MRSERLLLSVCVLLLSLGSVACAQHQPIKQTVMVPMSDGTTLATDIYFPDSPGADSNGKVKSWPARLIRTPYHRVRYNNEYGSQVKDGYVMIVQDMRGRFDSEGEDLAFLASGWAWHTDGVDTIKWIREQPWCNGHVGTEGASAMGITQYMLGVSEAPGLGAQYILVAAPSLYHHACYIGGALRASLVVGWLTDNAFQRDNVWQMVLHPFYDKRWEQLDAIARADHAHTPAIHFAGWFDVFQQGNIDGFVAWHNKGGDGARGQQKLIVGPWAHGGPNGRNVGEVAIPKNAQKFPDVLDAQRWFDHYLKGIDNGIDAEPAVMYYTMGALADKSYDGPGNEWRFADNWPVPADDTPYYLHADGSLSNNKPTVDNAKRAYDYNPHRPVPTLGGCLLTLPSGPYDQRELEERKDVLVFTSDPMVEPLEVTGRIKAMLTIMSDRVDTDFAVKLTDVYPDGRSMLICDGLARCRYRKGYDQLALLTPGKPTDIEVDLWSTSVVFDKGHRIRVTVTSSNYPKYDVNVNTGWPGVPMGPALPAHNEVLCGQQHASRIVLPIVASGK